jgi:hypothetical protein
MGMFEKKDNFLGDLHPILYVKGREVLQAPEKLFL